MLVRTLLSEGATLAYAGRWKRGAAELTKLLKKELSFRPPELSADEKTRSTPQPRFMSYLSAFNLKETMQIIDAEISKKERTRIGIALAIPHILAEDEIQWGEKDWSTREIERFRRRLSVTENSIARFVIGGKIDHIDSRGSGIVEETILSLIYNQPIYIAGGFGGAATDLGTALGLARIRTGVVPKSLLYSLTSNKLNQLIKIKERFRPPPLIDFPVTSSEQISFLHAHALGGKNWPKNGLNEEEYRHFSKQKSLVKLRNLY